jgi:hypothetical protein
MSWVDDVLDILESLIADGRPPDGVAPLLRVLRWLAATCRPSRRDEVAAVAQEVFGVLATAAAECLIDELDRLNEGAPGRWTIVRRGQGRVRIVHSSKPKAHLTIGVLPNLSILLESDRRGRNRYDKLLIPFGSNADQIFNLMDLVARDIYPLHFGENYRRYLGDARRLRAREREVRERVRPFFRFVHERRHELQLLVPLARLKAGIVVDGDLAPNEAASCDH